MTPKSNSLPILPGRVSPVPLRLDQRPARAAQRVRRQPPQPHQHNSFARLPITAQRLDSITHERAASTRNKKQAPDRREAQTTGSQRHLTADHEGLEGLALERRRVGDRRPIRTAAARSSRHPENRLALGFARPWPSRRNTARADRAAPAGTKSGCWATGPPASCRCRRPPFFLGPAEARWYGELVPLAAYAGMAIVVSRRAHGEKRVCATQSALTGGGYVGQDLLRAVLYGDGKMVADISQGIPMLGSI